MTSPVPDNRLQSSIILGFVGVICGLAGVAAWMGYATFEGRALHGRFRGLAEAETHRMHMYAGCFSLAQLLMGVLATAFGWIACRRARGPRWVAALGFVSIGPGTLALFLMILIV